MLKTKMNLSRVSDAELIEIMRRDVAELSQGPDIHLPYEGDLTEEEVATRGIFCDAIEAEFTRRGMTGDFERLLSQIGRLDVPEPGWNQGKGAICKLCGHGGHGIDLSNRRCARCFPTLG